MVFLIGMEEELLPHARTLMPTVTDAMDIDKACDLSEERRLAYVGISRAMARLYLCRSQARVVRGKRVARTPSRFLQELPNELLTERNLQSEAEAVVEIDEVSAFFSSMMS